MEFWKDIKGYEGVYQVSDLGRIKSLRDWAGNKSASKYVSRELILKPTDNGNGYLIVFLRKDAKRHRHYVHRLVADAFIPNQNNLPVVNHLDYNKQNNAATNLEWCSQRDNVRYSSERMKKPRSVVRTNTGEKHIIYRASADRYRVVIGKKEYTSCKTLDEAIKKRDAVLSRGVIE